MLVDLLVELVGLEELLHQLVNLLLADLGAPVVLKLVLNVPKFFAFLRNKKPINWKKSTVWFGNSGRGAKDEPHMAANLTFKPKSSRFEAH